MKRRLSGSARARGRHVPRAFVRQDLAIAQGDAAMGEGCDGGIVGDEDERCALPLVEVEEKVEDGLPVGGVEVAGGFVGEDDGGLEDEGAGESDALLLTAGELDGVVIGAVGEADGGEEGAGAGEAFGGGATGKLGVGVELVGEEDIFERGEGGDELVGLEDEAEGAAADGGELVFGEVGDGGAVEVDVAGGRGIETGEEAEEGRLAGAGGAHDGEELSGGDGEGDAFEDVEGAGAGAELLVQSRHLDHGERGGAGEKVGLREGGFRHGVRNPWVRFGSLDRCAGLCVSSVFPF